MHEEASQRTNSTLSLLEPKVQQPTNFEKAVRKHLVERFSFTTQKISTILPLWGADLDYTSRCLLAALPVLARLASLSSSAV